MEEGEVGELKAKVRDLEEKIDIIKRAWKRFGDEIFGPDPTIPQEEFEDQAQDDMVIPIIVKTEHIEDLQPEVFNCNYILPDFEDDGSDNFQHQLPQEEEEDLQDDQSFGEEGYHQIYPTPEEIWSQNNMLENQDLTINRLCIGKTEYEAYLIRSCFIKHPVLRLERLSAHQIGAKRFYLKKYRNMQNCPAKGCILRFPPEEIRSHLAESHPDFSIKYTCKYCDRIMQDPTNLYVHQRTHARDLSIQFRYRCRECGLGFEKENYFQKHCSTHNNVGSPRQSSKSYPIPCPSPGCSRKFLINAIRPHLASSHPDFQIKYTCSFCPRIFPNANSKKVHQRVVHRILLGKKYRKKRISKPKPKIKLTKNTPRIYIRTKFACPVMSCRILLQNDEIRAHLGEFHPHFKIKWVCSVCEKICPTSKHLYMHNRSHAEDPRIKYRYRCTVCDLGFQLKINYEKHLANKHGFKDQRSIGNASGVSELRNKLVGCPASGCPHKLPASEIRSHLNASHPDFRIRFVCKYCDRILPNRNYLRVHKREHAKDPNISYPYRCTFCGMGFYDRAFYERHLRIKHEGNAAVNTPLVNPEYVNVFETNCEVARHLGDQNGNSSETSTPQSSSFTSVRVKREIQTPNPLEFRQIPNESNITRIGRPSMLEQRGSFPYNCPAKCELKFSLDEMRSHLETSHPEFKIQWVCKYCERITGNYTYLRVHERDHAKDPNINYPFRCNACGLGFHIKNFFERHLSTHGGGVPAVSIKRKVPGVSKRTVSVSIKRKVLGVSIKRKKIKKVQLPSSSVIPRRTRCPVLYCTEKYFKHQMRDHLNSSHPEYKPDFACDHCSSVFKSANAKYLHIRKDHAKECTSIQCSICEIGFTHMNKYKLHMLKHRNSNGLNESAGDETQNGILGVESPAPKIKKSTSGSKEVACLVPGCSFVCPTSKHMGRHTYSFHRMIHICTIDKDCRLDLTRFEMPEHITQIHGEDFLAEYSCPKCSLLFVNKEKFKEHVKFCKVNAETERIQGQEMLDLPTKLEVDQNLEILET